MADGNNEKWQKLAALTGERKAAPLIGYCCVGSFHNSAYECEFVTPLTKSACNADAEVLIVAQDWASEAFLSKAFNPELARLGYDPKLPTNKNLQRLLKDHLSLHFSDTYATNLFPFIKPGHMSRKVPGEDLLWCARRFTLPQIEVVAPLMVICLGRSSTFASLAAALGHQAPQSSDEPLGPLRYENSEIFGVTHTGARSALWRSRVKTEWRFLAQRLRHLREKPRTQA